jgi:hypothetical protein
MTIAGNSHNKDEGSYAYNPALCLTFTHYVLFFKYKMTLVGSLSPILVSLRSAGLA